MSETFAQTLPPAREPQETGELPFTFGEAIRACRLGFRWATNVGTGCWMRMSVLQETPPLFCVELAAAKHLPGKPRGADRHVVWWEQPDASARLVAASPALQELAGRTLTGYLQWRLDELGNHVR